MVLIQEIRDAEEVAIYELLDECNAYVGLIGIQLKI